MEENRYGINWLGLFIKVIVFVVVVLLAIWLISKLTLKDKGLSFEENNKLFQDATVEYFKKNLPEEGKSLTITLNQLITWDYLEELKNEKGKTCDVKNSKSKIEIVDDYYSIKTTLVCDKKSETSYIKLGNEECTKCDVKVDGLKTVKKEETENKEETKKEETSTQTSSKENTTTNNKTNQSTNNTNKNNTTTKPTQTILYEYVKETIEYSDWYNGNVKGTNIENSTKKVPYGKYCKIEQQTYHTINYVTTKKDFSYTLELIDLGKDVSSVKRESHSYFTGYSDYKTYLSNKGKTLEMVGASKNSSSSIPSARTLQNASLTSDNFTYTLSKVYEENGRYYIDVNVSVKNLNDVTPYYLSTIKKNVYYVPIKFEVSYVDENNCIEDETANKDKYEDYKLVDKWKEEIDIYRYKIVNKEYVYSATPLEGYTKTGKTKKVS